MAVSAITDYTSLYDAIADFLDRKDLTYQIPLFVQQVEMELNRTLRVRQMLVKAQSQGWRSTPVIPLPTDFLEARVVEIVYAQDDPENPGNNIDGDKFQATYQPPGVLDQMKQENPQFRANQDVYHYTFSNDTLEIFPEPADGVEYRIDLEFYQKIQGVASSADPVAGTNWLHTEAPDAYLYGALKHAAVFLRDDERVPIWNKMYTDAVEQLRQASDRSLRSGSRLTRKTNLRF